MKLSEKVKFDFVILGAIIVFLILDLMLIHLPGTGKAYWEINHLIFFIFTGFAVAFIGGIFLITLRVQGYKFHWVVFIIYCLSMPSIIWCINVREFALAVAAC